MALDIILKLFFFSQRTGRRLSKPEVDATFREFDQNKVNLLYCSPNAFLLQDNKLSYKEFCVMMNRKRRPSTSGSREVRLNKSLSFVMNNIELCIQFFCVCLSLLKPAKYDLWRGLPLIVHFFNGSFQAGAGESASKPGEQRCNRICGLYYQNGGTNCVVVMILF